MRIKEKKADEAGIGAFISSYLFKKLKDFHYPPEVMIQILAQVLYVVFKDYCKQYKELGLETEQFKVQEKLQLVISEENPYRDFFHNKLGKSFSESCAKCPIVSECFEKR